MPIQKASETTGQFFSLIYGPPKAGKTITAATVSTHWPKVVSSEEDTTYLADCLWLSFDDGATDSFIDHDVDADELTFEDGLSCRKMFQSAQTVSEGMNQLGEELASCLTDQHRHIVVDTLSEFDSLIGNHWARVYSDETKSMAKFRMIAETHVQFHQLMSACNAHVIYLCHAKAIGGVDIGKDVKQKRRQEMQKKARISDDVEIRPKVTGSGLEMYLANVSLYSVLRKRNNLLTKEWERVLLPFGDATFEGGTRFENRLSEFRETGYTMGTYREFLTKAGMGV